MVLGITAAARVPGAARGGGGGGGGGGRAIKTHVNIN